MVLKNRSPKQLGYSLIHSLFKGLTGSCSVLLYHRVCRLDHDYLSLAVTPDNFFEQVNHLKNYHRILKADEFKEIVLQKKKFPRGSVLLTFDDGYADNYINALPVLESLNVEAIFFISTGFVDRQIEFWWDKLDNIIVRNGSILGQINFNGTNIKLNSNGDCINAFNLIFPVLRTLSPPDRNKVINEWAMKANIHYERQDYRPMTWEELKRFSESPSTVIGGHTINHPSLGYQSIKEQRFEIENSKLDLEQRLDKKILFFSYPFGQACDFNKDTIEICRQIGYEIVFANYPAHVTMASKRFCLPRFVIRDWDLSEFEKQISFILK